MKKLVLFFLMIFLTAASDAQIVNKYSFSELSQEQLNNELARSLKSIRTGEIIAGTGISFGLIGGIFILYGVNESKNSTEILGGLPGPATIAGIGLVIGSIATTASGIIKVTSGQHRKKAIEMELVKFQSAGSAAINGIGLKIRF